MQRAKAFAIFLLLPLFCSGAAAQTTSVLRPPTRVVDRAEVDHQRRLYEMRTLEMRSKQASRKAPVVPEEPKLSAEERSRVLKLRHVAPADVAAYSSLLNQDRTGIFKLFPDNGCRSKKVVRLAGECERSVPLSSSFTFRTVTYGDEDYHDIFFKGERISSNAFFSQGIFSIVGDEPLEKVGLSHPALRYLQAFQPDTDPKLAFEHAQKLQAGVEFEGHRYSNGISPNENVTYAVRLIAYRLENAVKPLSTTSTMNEMMFLSLAVDKRVDIIVAFRILGRDEHGGLTIVWKELSRHDAPRIKFGKSQPLRDFKPA